MKRLVTIFSNGTYISGPNGEITTYTHDDKLCDVLGQAKDIRMQLIGDRTTGVDTRARIRVYESSDPDRRPSEVGKQVGSSTDVDNDLRPPLIQVNGPFSARVEVLLDILDKKVTPDTQQEFQLGLYATLILEE